MDGNKGNNGHGKYAVSCFTQLAVSQFLVKRNSDYEITSLKFFLTGLASISSRSLVFAKL